MNLQQAMLAAQLAHARAAAAQDLIDNVDRILSPVGIRLYRWAPAGPVCPNCRREDDWVEQLGTHEIYCRCQVTD
jgi:hypothetical protein